MIVTRFPPSPTGFLHVGGLRTALYNYLLARKLNGRFILRIEDTDQKRYVDGAVENLIATLKWAGLNYDEGPDIGGPHAPYVQSQRIAMYKKAAEELPEKGAAYRCFCTPERLEEMRKEREKKQLAPKYDRRCLQLSKSEISALLEKRTACVIRQKIPDAAQANAVSQSPVGTAAVSSAEVSWNDHIRGKVSFLYENLDDQILLKSDGFPTYHLANVVDDHDMEVTHVIRGEEWLSSTPKHILLYQALGWKIPEFGHLPLLLDKNRQKLSKRMGHVAVEDYIKEGFLPEAVLNFVALLGWHPGAEISAKTLSATAAGDKSPPNNILKATRTRGEKEREIFTLEEMIRLFSLEKVHKAGAIFDIEKLRWMNWQWRRKKYMEALPPGPPQDSAVHDPLKGTGKFMNARMEALKKMTDIHLPAEWKSSSDPDFLGRCLVTVEEKILQEPAAIRQYIEFYFKDRLEIPASLLLSGKMKVDAETAKKSLAEVMEALQSWSDFSSPEKIQPCLMTVIQKLGFKNSQVLWPTRVALTGEQFSPGVFEVIWALGKEKTLQRLGKNFS